jgi:ankyrin repeat protein
MLSKLLFVTLTSLAFAQSQPDPNAAFFDALSAGDSAKVQKLLEGGFDPNARSRTYPALVLAFWARKPETPAIITALLKAGADPSAVGSDTKAAPQLAAEQPERSLIDAFLDNGVAADWKNNNQESLLGIASAYGHVQVVSRLLERGASIDAQDDEGFTPLMNACQNRHVEVVRILLQKKANRSLKNRYGETALSLVQGKYQDTQAGKTRREIVALLEGTK